MQRATDNRGGKVIAICGVAGHNRGDDAIAIAMANEFLARLPGVTVQIAMLVLGSIPKAPGIEPFLALRRSPAGLFSLVRAIARSDLVIVGGGSLIQDKFGGGRIKGVLGYAWLVSRLALLFRKPFITAPLGIDTLESDHAKLVAAEFLAAAQAIFVRDEQSLANGRALLADSPRDRIVRVCDPAFSLSEGGGGDNRAGPIVLAPAFEGEYDELIVDIFRRVAIHAVTTLDRDVVVLSMDERDSSSVRKIVDTLPDQLRGRVRPCIPATLSETLAVLHGASELVAMRLHAMILSFGVCPISCLSRTTKTHAFMEDYHVPGLAVKQHDPETTASILVEAVRAWPQRDVQLAVRGERLGDLAKFFDTVVAIIRARA